MKKIMIPVLMGAMLVLACSKVETGNENTVKDDLLREVELTINVPQGDTKTYIEKSGSVYNPYWKNGDKLYVMTAADPSTKKTFTNGAANGADASFTGTINLAAGNNTLIAFYPQNVTKIDRAGTTYKLSWGEGGADNDKQTLPSLTSFDPLHDILVAKPVVVNVAAAGSKTSVDMQFRRIMSVAKVTLVNATTNDYLDDAKVTSIKLTSSTTNLSGRICFDANTDNASVTGVDNTVSKSVTASYAGGDFAINGTNSAYIIVPPVTLTTGSKLTVDVYTDKLGLTIHKEVDLAADLVFNAGAVKPLSVSLTDACVELDSTPAIVPVAPSKLAYDATSGTFNFTISHPDGVSSPSASVTSGGSWLALAEPAITESAGVYTVHFTCSANNALSAVERNGQITVSYTGATSMPVTITQAGVVEDYVWNFSSEGWQSAMNSQALAAKDTKATGWSVSYDGLTYNAGSDDRWSVNGYIQPNGSGYYKTSSERRYFLFTVSGGGYVYVKVKSNASSDKTADICAQLGKKDTADFTRSITSNSSSFVTAELGPFTEGGNIAVFLGGSGHRIYSIEFHTSRQTIE